MSPGEIIERNWYQAVGSQCFARMAANKSSAACDQYGSHLFSALTAKYEVIVNTALLEY
jgi:hypothetical protein